LKIMNFENVPLTKVIYVYVIEGMNAQYIWYNIIFLPKIYLYLKCNVKSIFKIQNLKLQINTKQHMWYAKKTFTLVSWLLWPCFHPNV
jgi:hypothetical protein